MLIRRIFLSFSLLFIKRLLCANQTMYTINGKEYVHVVSDKFLSVSVDPAILMSGLNASGASLSLITNLNPAYVRIAGPSTEFPRLTENDNLTDKIRDETVDLPVSRSQWNSVNEWFAKTNLVPVFSINARDGKFDPKTLLFLLDLAEKRNTTCLWELGYDSANKLSAEYLEQINLLRRVIYTFPSETKRWKIVGSLWQQQDSFKNFNKQVQALQDVTYSIMWKRKQDEEYFPQNDFMTKLLSSNNKKSKLSVWTTAPKTKHAVSFSSGLLWAKQIGEAARKGFKVLFREPQLNEFFSATPVYWISVLHKKLMGVNVLDVKPNGVQNVDVDVFAHCTKCKTILSNKGAATIFVVNNASFEHVVALKVTGVVQLKKVEVRSYFVTSNDQDSLDTYLNGEKLTLQDHRLELTPKIHRARVNSNKYLTLSVPSKSVCFFVLPDAKVPVCFSSENERQLLIEKNRTKQNMNDEDIKISSTFKERNAPPVDWIQKELETDEEYYNARSGVNGKVYKLNQELTDDFMESKSPALDAHVKTRKVIHEQDRCDESEILGKKNGLSKRLIESSNFIPKTSDKLTDVLTKSSSKKWVEKNIHMCSEESDEIRTATNIINGEEPDKIKYKREAKGGGRGTGHGRGGGSKGRPKPKPPSPKPKRAINMELLHEKAHDDEQRKIASKLGTRSDKKAERRQEKLDFFSEVRNRPEKNINHQIAKKIKLDFKKISHPAKIKHQQLEPDTFDSHSLENEDEDYLNEYDSMDSLEEDDDTKDYQDLQDKIGAFKIRKPPTQNAQKELRGDGHHGQDGHQRKFPNDVNVFLNKEFVVNEQGDDDAVKKTIQTLENYLNHAKNVNHNNQAENFSLEDEYDEIDDANFGKSSWRFKRETEGYTEEDVRYYRQLMNSNIKHMRDSMRKQQRANFKLRKSGSPFQALKLKYAVDGKAPRSQSSPRTKTNKSTEVNDLPFTMKYNDYPNVGNKENAKYSKGRPVAQLRKIEGVQSGRLRNREPEVNGDTHQLVKLIKDELKKRRPRSCARDTTKVDLSNAV